MDVLNFLPDSVVAGESIWISASNTVKGYTDITIPDFTPPTAALAYQFDAPTPISVTAVANGDNTGWTLEVTGTQTLLWYNSVISFVAFATVSERVYQVDSGTIRVTQSPLRVSSWTAVVTAIDAAILTYAAQPVGSISVEGMSLSYRSLDDLIKLRDYAIYMQNKDSSSKVRRIIRTRFEV